MTTLIIAENTFPEYAAATIAKELDENGSVSLLTRGRDALPRAFESASIAKRRCAAKNVDIMKVTSVGGETTLILRVN